MSTKKRALVNTINNTTVTKSKKIRKIKKRKLTNNKIKQINAEYKLYHNRQTDNSVRRDDKQRAEMKRAAIQRDAKQRAAIQRDAKQSVEVKRRFDEVNKAVHEELVRFKKNENFFVEFKDIVNTFFNDEYQGYTLRYNEVSGIFHYEKKYAPSWLLVVPKYSQFDTKKNRVYTNLPIDTKITWHTHPPGGVGHYPSVEDLIDVLKYQRASVIFTKHGVYLIAYHGSNNILLLKDLKPITVSLSQDRYFFNQKPNNDWLLSRGMFIWFIPKDHPNLVHDLSKFVAHWVVL